MSILKLIFTNRFCFGWITGMFFLIFLVAIICNLTFLWQVIAGFPITMIFYCFLRYVAFKYFDD